MEHFLAFLVPIELTSAYTVTTDVMLATHS